MSASFFAALYCAFGKYDIVHIHAGGRAFVGFPNYFGKGNHYNTWKSRYNLRKLGINALNKGFFEGRFF